MTEEDESPETRVRAAEETASLRTAQTAFKWLHRLLQCDSLSLWVQKRAHQGLICFSGSDALRGEKGNACRAARDDFTSILAPAHQLTSSGSGALTTSLNGPKLLLGRIHGS